MGDKLQVWDDGPPPREWSVGIRRPGDMGLFDRTFGEYTGWVRLDSLRKITIYGKMQGIRFSFKNAQKDKFFGCDGTKNEETHIQNIGHGERIIGIAVLLDDNIASDSIAKVESIDKVHLANASNNGDFQSPLGRIHFLTDRNQAKRPLPVKYRILCPYLVAIRFDFNYHQLVSWAPIYASNPAIQESLKVVSEMVQYPWKCRTDDIVPSGEIKEESHVACIFFDEEENKRVDAVKGYVSRSGHFCGLIFRRNGDWGNEVFGNRSAYEVTMELKEGETFTSLYLPHGDIQAIAVRFKSFLPRIFVIMLTVGKLCTNSGRTTPWFGNVTSESAELQNPPQGQEAIGIYGTLDGVSSLPFYLRN